MIFDHEQEHVDSSMILFQANLDDMNPEITSYVTDVLLSLGVNDVYWIPIIMKRGRPGVMLNVLAGDSMTDTVEAIIFRETTTLGIRRLPVAVHRLGRQIVKVDTLWGPISVKVGYQGGKLVQYAPEFRECEEIARTKEIPLKKVYDEVRMSFQKEHTVSE